jgi:hypothetical protein
MTINHDVHKCHNIYFVSGARINNQHLLEYEKAFVDMQLTSTKWNMMSAPLKNMYAGDMFIPHNGDYLNGSLIEENNPFEVSSFQGTRAGDAAYAFWLSFYNRDIITRFEGNKEVKSTATAEFRESNSLTNPLEVGQGFQLLGFGPGDNVEELTIRLPKPDERYSYFSPSGYETSSVAVPSREEAYRLAFTPTDNTMQITLTNGVESNAFVFGNPTLSYIDMRALLADNEQFSSEFYYMQNDSWQSATVEVAATSSDRYLPPMRSVMLKLRDGATATTAQVELSTDHLTLNNSLKSKVAPMLRAPQREATQDIELMTIYAFAEGNYARCMLATHAAANDYYLQGEDALFLSSGVDVAVEDNSAISPLNLYTVAEQVPMMTDVRQGVSKVPVAVVVNDDARVDSMQIAFYLSPNWTSECYLYDSIADTRYRIMDGLVLTLAMPQNHEQRYYIEGPDEYIGSNDNPGGGVTTSTSTLTPMDKLSLNAFSVNANELVVTASTLMREVKIYDMAGRLIADKVLDLFHNTTTLAVPSGICIVEAILRDGTALHTQTIVR